MFRNALTIVTLLALAAGAGCGRRQAPDPAPGRLDGVPVSADLAPALEQSRRHLDLPEPAAASVAEVDRYEDLLIRLKDPDARRAAGDEVYALWQADPTHFLWAELAINNQYLLDRSEDLERMLDLPALADTTTAVGAFMAGRARYKQTDRGRMFRRAKDLQGDLDPLQRVWLDAWLASADHGRGDTEGALHRLLARLPEAWEAGGADLEYTLWRQISSLLARIDRLDDAMHAIAMAENLAAGRGNRYRVLEAKIRGAGIREQRLEHAAALQDLQDCADAAAGAGFWWLQQDSLDDAAEICVEIGDYDRALAIDRRNLELARTLDDSLNLPRILASIAHDHRMSGRLDSCYVYLDMARVLVDRGEDRRNRARMASLLAEYHCLVGDYAQADSLLAVAEGVGSGAGTAALEAQLLLEMLPQAESLGRADLAYRWLDRLAGLKPALHDTGFDQNLRADFELASVRLLGRQGEFGLAAAALKRAEDEVARGGGEQRLLEWRFAAGELARLRGDAPTAREHFAACLELADQAGNAEQVSRARFHLGGVLLQEGRCDETLALFGSAGADTAFGGRFRDRLARQLFIGLAQAGRGDHDRAAAAFAAALDRCTPYSPRDLVTRLEVESARSALALGRMDEAATRLRRVLDAGLDPADRTGPALRDLLGTDPVRDAVLILIGIELARGGPAGRRTLALAEQVVGPVPGASLPAAGHPLLVFLVGRERSYAWAVGPDRIDGTDLPGRKELLALVAPVVADFGAPGRVPDPAAARKLADLVLGAASAVWDQNETLVIRPDGLLHEVPWSALPLPASFAAEPGAIALDRGPVVLEVAGSVAKAGSGPAGLTLLAAGCDSAPEDGGPALRHAEREAALVAGLWPQGRSVLRVGNEAGWSALRTSGLAEAGVVHLASHAQVHRGLPSRSTLRLDGAGAADPVTVPEIAALELPAELVFLSCCEAARGEGAAGVADFAGAFLAAGARSVIASTRWVDDEASAFLAERFYTHWLEGMTRAEALRASRLELRKARPQWAHPAYWGFHRLLGAAD